MDIPVASELLSLLEMNLTRAAKIEHLDEHLLIEQECSENKLQCVFCVIILVK